MAIRKQRAAEQILPSVTPQKGIELLERCIAKGENLIKNRPLDSTDLKNWQNQTKDVLIRAFGSPSQHVSNVTNAGGGSFYMNQSDEYYEQLRADELSSKIAAVRSVIEVLELEIELDSPTVVLEKELINSSKVFLVHGHDEAARESVARFLEKLDLDVVVLHERPNQGKTIIEKFLSESDVGFAVVLLTGDDIGGSKGTPFEQLSDRARQNVIFELGFFIGKIGRSRVCALYQQAVEIPSDYDGVLFVPLDNAGHWKLLLGKELRSAGIDIDMNRLI